MSGILDYINPSQLALLGASSSLLQAGGPSRTPVSFGQALGQGIQGGLGGLQQAQQFQQMEQMNQFRAAQAEEMKRKAAAQAQQQEAMERLKADPRFAGLGDLLQVHPEAAIKQAFPTPAGADSPFAKINPKDFTPESVRKFSMTKNPADLVAASPDKTATESDLARLTRERDAFPADHPNRALWDAKIKKVTEQGPAIEIKNLPPDRKFEWEDKLRSDYKTDVKAYREVEDAHRIIKGALQNPTPANDMAAATKFMKLLDPGSVVRESELQMAMQASGVLDRMANYHNLLLRGQKLTPQQREDFAAAADIIYNNVQSKWREMDSIYDESAKAYGLDPRRVKMGGGAASKLPVMKKYNPKTGKIE
jgi:hypothetical protein